MAAEYLLYGAQLSLYTGKARAYMRYKGLDWEEQLATPDIKPANMTCSRVAACSERVCTSAGWACP